MTNANKPKFMTTRPMASDRGEVSLQNRMLGRIARVRFPPDLPATTLRCDVPS